MDFDRDRYKASTHYVWRQDPADILGEGAFGTVYRGLHKETCESVAIKTFNKLSLKRPYIVQMRELNILEKLDHPNVVKLIAIEEELISSRSSGGKPAQSYNNNSLEGKVLIMELCSEGNLYGIIEQPENQFGLDESELLRVLSHTTSGLKYLKEMHIVHRDWKPSNILKTVTTDGDILYKLCDFGAARELEENQPFLSIVGTEEYIPPEIYGRALLGVSGQCFFATSELWSFGVTLYHVATGQLPFKPFGGRKNRETMYQILSSKQTGIISGVQESENGPINWSSELPSHCRLSGQCKVFLTQLLAHLLETDKDKMWSFDQFFEEIEQFLSKERICCMTTNCKKEFVYIDKSSNSTDLIKLISEQFHIGNEAGSDLWCYCGSSIFNYDTACPNNFRSVEHLSAQSLKSPLLIVEPGEDSGQNSVHDRNFEFPVELKFEENSPTNLAQDYDVANRCAALLFWALQGIKDRIGCRDTCLKAANSLTTRLTSLIELVENRWSLLNQMWTMLQHSLLTLKRISNLPNNVATLEEKLLQLSEALKSEISTLQAIKSEFLGLHDHLPVVKDSNILTILDRSLCSVFEISMQFRNDKVLARHATDKQNNELKWHGLLMKQLKDIWCRVKDQLNSNSLNSILEQYSRFFSCALKLHSKIGSSREGSDLVEHMISVLDGSLKQVVNSIENRVAPSMENCVNSETKSMKKQRQVVNDVAETKICDSLLSTLKDIRELRTLAQMNRSVCVECVEFSHHMIQRL